jgi:phytoene synthase
MSAGLGTAGDLDDLDARDAEPPGRHVPARPEAADGLLADGMPGDPSELDRRATLVMARVARTFDVATRFLPGDARRDVRRLYLVLRTLDDLVDLGDPAAEQAIADVDAWARSGWVSGSLASILDDLAARHPALPRDAVVDFCSGMRADLVGPVHRTDADLEAYCYQVAGTVGRLMAVLLGVRPGVEREADTAARALGSAMQRTNILRDLAEDACRGRCYLPDDALRDAGVDLPDAVATLAGFMALSRDVRARIVRPQAVLAEAGYRAGIEGTRHLVHGRRAIVAAALMYREILRQIEREEWGGRRPRVVVSRARKALLVARASITR